MKIPGCNLHAKPQTIAMMDTETGEFTEQTLRHEGNEVREFYAALEGPVVVGIEATGAMQWFLQLLEELGIVCRVGHPAKIRAAETRKQKHDRRDARLILDLLMREDGFPEIWMPTSDQRDLRTLLRDRHQWVKIRTRVQNTLQAMALNHALRRGRGLWTATGQKALQALSLPRYTSQRRDELLRFIPAIAAADPGTGRASRKTSPATAAGAPLVDASRCGTSDSIGDGGIPGRPEPLRQWQERSQLLIIWLLQQTPTGWG
jgi:transposase